MTLCNMVIEAGGKNGVIAPDQVTADFVRARTSKPFEMPAGDPDARYAETRVYRSQEIEPLVAKPPAPDQRATVRSCQGLALDRCYIGSCTGGKLTDFRAAATIMNGRQVKVDTFVVPATTDVARGLETERIGGRTLLEIFQTAGAKIGEASCAACLGGPADTFGRLNKNEVCLSTTSRNFPGRMGSKTAQVYLASPYTVAASAVTGRMTDPRDFLS